MAKKSNRPMWFKLFLNLKALVDSVPDETVGKAIKAIFTYFDSKEIVEMDPLVFAIFSSLKPYGGTGLHGKAPKGRGSGSCKPS